MKTVTRKVEPTQGSSINSVKLYNFGNTIFRVLNKHEIVIQAVSKAQDSMKAEITIIKNGKNGKYEVA